MYQGRNSYLKPSEYLLEIFTTPWLPYALELRIDGFNPQGLVLILAHLSHVVDRTEAQLCQSIRNG